MRILAPLAVLALCGCAHFGLVSESEASSREAAAYSKGTRDGAKEADEACGARTAEANKEAAQDQGAIMRYLCGLRNPAKSNLCRALGGIK